MNGTRRGRALVGWDSNVFLAWLKGEDEPPGKLGKVRFAVDKVMSGAVDLLVSTLVRTEVLTSALTPEREQQFLGFLDSGRLFEASVDPPISTLARELRSYYQELGGLSLSTPDAIHLATAIHYEAAEFLTFDRRNTRGTLGLLGLSGNVAGYKLRIVEPGPGGPLFD